MVSRIVAVDDAIAQLDVDVTSVQGLEHLATRNGHQDGTA